jgi:hypothetical protein
MSRSMFQASPFRASYGVQPVRVMGQPVFQGNFLDDLTGGDVGGIMKDLDELILKLPVDVAGNYSKRRDECIAKPLISQYKCLYDLFQDIKKAYKGDGTPTAPPPPPPPPPAKSEFPIVPVAIGAVAAVAILYAAFGRN